MKKVFDINFQIWNNIDGYEKEYLVTYINLLYNKISMSGCWYLGNDKNVRNEDYRYGTALGRSFHKRNRPVSI